MIDPNLVVGDILFATSRDRCSYLGTANRDRPKWLADHPGSWRYVHEVLEEEASLLVKTETEVGTVKAESNVRKDGDDEDDVASVDSPGGDRSHPDEPISLPTPVKADFANGSAKAELLSPAKAAMSEAEEPKTETTPLEATGHKRGPGGGRQHKKQNPPAGNSKAGPKLSPERMRIVLDSLAEYPIKGRAAMKAGIFRKTLDYWLKRSAAGDDQYDVEWRGETAKFHEHFEGAMLEAYDNLFATMRDFAMGGVVYKYDEALLSLGFEGPDAYQRDEYGDPVVETVRKANPKMMLRLLEWKRPDPWDKHRKIDVPHQCGVLVVGDPAKKKREAISASIKARKWKARSRMLRNAKT